MKFTRVLASLLIATILLPITALAAPPVASSFSTAVPANRQSLILLQGSDPEGTALTFAATSSPAHGTLSGLNAATGYVVYTPAAGYVGGDSFTFTVTSGGETSAPATVTLTVTNAKTRVVDTITDAGGNPRKGKVTFILTQVVTTPAALTPVGSSVSSELDLNGRFDVSVYPSQSLSPAAYYQVWFDDAATQRHELLGIYDIPAAITSISLAGRKVTDTNLAAKYTFVSMAALQPFAAAVANASIAQLLAGSHTENKVQKWNAATGFVDSAITENGSTVTIDRPTTVNGTLTATGGVVGITTANIPATLANNTLTNPTINNPTINNPTINNPTITGLTLNNLSSTNSTLTTPKLIAPTVQNGVSVTGDVTVSGNVTATNIIGNRSGCTGVGTGSGGRFNPDSVTFAADTNVDGVGYMDFLIKNLPALRIHNNGGTEVFGPLKQQEVLNLNAYLAKGDEASVTASMTAGSAALTTSTNVFSVSDVGKIVTVPGAANSGAHLNTTIAAYISPTQVNLAVAATTAVTSATISYGTDNAAAFATAMTAAATGRRAYLPHGRYKTSAPLAAVSGLVLEGAGKYNTVIVAANSNGINIRWVNGVVIRDLTVDGLTTTYGVADRNLIDVQGSSDVEIRNVRLLNAFDHGIYVNDSGAPSRRISLISNRIDNTFGNGIQVIAYGSVADTLTGVKAESNFISRVHKGIGIMRSGGSASTGTYVRRVSVLRNHIWDTRYMGIELWGGVEHWLM